MSVQKLPMHEQLNINIARARSTHICSVDPMDACVYGSGDFANYYQALVKQRYIFSERQRSSCSLLAWLCYKVSRTRLEILSVCGEQSQPLSPYSHC